MIRLTHLTRVHGLYSPAMALVLTLFATAASSQGTSNANTTTKVFHIANASSSNDANEVVVALRQVIDPGDKIFFLQSTNDVIVSASPEEVARIGRILSELDKPKHLYRVTYTLAESDAGKRIGVQHFAMIVLLGQRVDLKQGDKVPIATGSFDKGTNASQTQFTYLDVGINLSTTIDAFAEGVRLRSKVEQSSVAEGPQGGKLADDPILRQSVLEGTSVLTPGKPLTLGGLDIVGSTRHIDIEVVAEQIS